MNTIFDILQFTSFAPPVTSSTPRTTCRFQSTSDSHLLYLHLDGNDLLAAYGRLLDAHSVLHEIFLHEAMSPHSPVLSPHIDGLRSVAEQAGHFQLVAVSSPAPEPALALE